MHCTSVERWRPETPFALHGRRAVGALEPQLARHADRAADALAPQFALHVCRAVGALEPQLAMHADRAADALGPQFASHGYRAVGALEPQRAMHADRRPGPQTAADRAQTPGDLSLQCTFVEQWAPWNLGGLARLASSRRPETAAGSARGPSSDALGPQCAAHFCRVVGAVGPQIASDDRSGGGGQRAAAAPPNDGTGMVVVGVIGPGRMGNQWAS